jgi:sortase A
MNPNDGSQGGGTPNPPTPNENQSAAANVLRSQIDALYGERPGAIPTRPVERPQQVMHHEQLQPQADQWKEYHTAWQNYYQQYYSAYYTHQQAQATPQTHTVTTPPTSDTPTTAQNFFTHQDEPEGPDEDVSKDQALFELRQKLLGTVRTQATKIRKSRHFIPIAASLAVVLIFLFLQYNRVLLATVNAYVSPGSIDPQNIVIDPSGGNVVSQDSRLIIPKINVDVPAIYDVSSAYDAQMSAMEKGVAHFAIPGASSHPGEIGNTVLSGHSSNDLFDPGEYKFIFAQLEKLNTSDTVYANYKGVRYTYVVTKKEVVLPTEVNKLVYSTNKPVMTLITCTPLGTAQKRLLITAEQVSPDPAVASAAPVDSGQGSTDASIPGYSPTLLERLFGAR